MLCPIMLAMVWTLLSFLTNQWKALASDNFDLENRHAADFDDNFDGDVFSTLRSVQVMKNTNCCRTSFTTAGDQNQLHCRTTGLTCRLCLLVDQEFLGVYGKGSRDEMMKRLDKLVDSVGWNWRAVDWNGDEFPDNIGFQIASVMQSSSMRF